MRSPEVDVSWLQRHILQEFVRLTKGSLACDQVEMLREWTANKPEDRKTSQCDGSVNERLRYGGQEGFRGCLHGRC